ncbi:hypothetical protein P43SY_009816 [Pythium insidiosum]|uniref:DNA polymerase alpha/epsilon subunit B n=1 Tax=Pythium insidiosum TaxID=114742 RepID=A0AAD5LHL9_PYTIN|nr:hypothetical protein P43SY_009816 [Pythium insidiosum]
MAPTDAQIERQSVSYRPTYQRFVLKQKSYSQQYSHIYVSRLLQLRDVVLRRVEELLASRPAEQRDVPVLSKIIDLRPGTECIIIGTVLKMLASKPDLFDALSSDEKIVSLTSLRVKMATPNDELVLEDESGRVELTGDAISVGEMATGVVLGVRGRMVDGKGGFHVEEVIVPSFPPQPPLPKRAAPAYVALVSGLRLGRDNESSPLRYHLLMDYLAGRIGGDDEKAFVSQIVRTIVVGESVDGAGVAQLAKQKKSSKDAAATIEQMNVEAAPMRNLDELLSTLASAMSVDVLPGDNDPSNHALPQQSFHSCLFPRSARFASFRAVTNPYEAQIGDVAFLGHAGQPLHSLLQCTLSPRTEAAALDADDVSMQDAAEDSDPRALEDALDCMERCLEWRHVAPTAPDLISSFPVANEDPFVVETCPHVFFAGNAPAFGSRLVEGPNGQRVRVVLVPSFAETSTVVLVDLQDLSCFPISISL